MTNRISRHPPTTTHRFPSLFNQVQVPYKILLSLGRLPPWQYSRRHRSFINLKPPPPRHSVSLLLLLWPIKSSRPSFLDPTQRTHVDGLFCRVHSRRAISLEIARIFTWLHTSFPRSKKIFFTPLYVNLVGASAGARSVIVSDTSCMKKQSTRFPLFGLGS